MVCGRTTQAKLEHANAAQRHQFMAERTRAQEAVDKAKEMIMVCVVSFGFCFTPTHTEAY
jgi:precorrin-3B methylase